MKRKFAVAGAICALSLGLLVTSCNKEVNKVKPITTVTITNKEKLQSEWHVAQANRLIEFDVDSQDVNVLEALTNGDIKFESTNNEVLVVSGKYISAVKEGEATVKASVKTKDENGETVFKVTDEVKITVDKKLEFKKDNKVYNVSDILNVEENNFYQYTVKGKIKKLLGKNKDGDKYGNMVLEDLNDSNKTIRVYGSTSDANSFSYNDVKCEYTFTNPKDYLTNEYTKGLKVGDEVVIRALVTKNKDEKVIQGVVYYDVETIYTLNFDKTKTYYVYGVVSDYTSYKGVKNKDFTAYGNFYLKGGDASIMVYGSTYNKEALLPNGDTYKIVNDKQFLTNEYTSKLKLEDTVYMKVVRCDYKGTAQISGEIVNIDYKA
ncbi:MAG: hypothetical protein ACTTID_00855 [Bacillales bacterium]